MILAPSILSADFADLKTAVNQCKAGGAEWIHVDVMDNHFVPNLTIGPVVVSSLRKVTDLFLDVHLMVTDPASLVEPFAEAGADAITIHLEATDRVPKLIDIIRSRGLKTGVSIKPKTSLEDFWPILSLIDLVLVMSVEPGFGGQSFIPDALDRVREIDQRRKTFHYDRLKISVDGGIKPENAQSVLDAGADILVSGSGVFGTENPVKTMQSFLALNNS